MIARAHRAGLPVWPCFGGFENMLMRAGLIMMGFLVFGFWGLAFADGKTGGGPSHVAPPPLTSHGVSPPVPTRCEQTCSTGRSYSGHATNPRPSCYSGCGQAEIHHQPPEHHHSTRTVIHTETVDQGLRLDSSTIASMTGGVGVGVNDVFVGGGGFVGSSNFGLRSSGFFARRNASFVSIRRSSFKGRKGGGRRH